VKFNLGTAMTKTLEEQEKIREQVREGYTKIAQKGIFSVSGDEASCGGGGCCGSQELDVEALVKNIGYTDTELEGAPESANMGLSCGNPTVIASLKEGEIVLDLGSGGGFDVFIAAPKVGTTGRVIGVDMTPEMISKARRNTKVYEERTGLRNVEFRLGEIEHLPVADSSVDVVISNCVLNLSPDKEQVWKEIARVLKPGGRVAISDLSLIKPLPQEILDMMEAMVGCIAGAVTVAESERMATEAGLTEIMLHEKSEYIDAMAKWEDPLYQKVIQALPQGAKASEYITSLDLTARKI